MNDTQQDAAVRHARESARRLRQIAAGQIAVGYVPRNRWSFTAVNAMYARWAAQDAARESAKSPAK